MRETGVTRRMTRQEIIADIERMISSGEWPPGTKLPTHKALAEHYGISTTQLDGIMDFLKGRQLITGIQGGRRYVTGAPEQDATGVLPRPPRPSTEDRPDETDDQP